jgi:hypothetical protein
VGHLGSVPGVDHLASHCSTRDVSSLSTLGRFFARAIYSSRMADKRSQTMSERSQAIANLEALIDTTMWCEKQIREVRKSYSVTLAELQAGSPVTDALNGVHAGRVRPKMTEAIAALEAARRKSRISLVRADLAEGSSVTQIARTWGASHQLISRYMRSGDDTVD